MTTQEQQDREDAALDALIVLALRGDEDLNPDFVATTVLTPAEKATIAGIDIKELIAKAKRLRTAYTTAPSDYDGFGTVTYEFEAGTDNRGLTVRKVGIEPDHWDWQTGRYLSGMHAVATEEEARRFPSIWRLSHGR